MLRRDGWGVVLEEVEHFSVGLHGDEDGFGGSNASTGASYECELAYVCGKCVPASQAIVQTDLRRREFLLGVPCLRTIG